MDISNHNSFKLVKLSTTTKAVRQHQAQPKLQSLSDIWVNTSAWSCPQSTVITIALPQPGLTNVKLAELSL